LKNVNILFTNYFVVGGGSQKLSFFDLYALKILQLERKTENERQQKF